jgi:hypothetical protein
VEVQTGGEGVLGGGSVSTTGANSDGLAADGGILAAYGTTISTANVQSVAGNSLDSGTLNLTGTAISTGGSSSVSVRATHRIRDQTVLVLPSRKQKTLESRVEIQ